MISLECGPGLPCPIFCWVLSESPELFSPSSSIRAVCTDPNRESRAWDLQLALSADPCVWRQARKPLVFPEPAYQHGIRWPRLLYPAVGPISCNKILLEYSFFFLPDRSFSLLWHLHIFAWISDDRVLGWVASRRDSVKAMIYEFQSFAAFNFFLFQLVYFRLFIFLQGWG